MGAAMLDLETLFGDKGAGTVPSPSAAAKTAKSIEAQAIKAESPGTAGVEVGHSGHNGNTPDFDEVCPPKPLQHNGFSELGTLGTVGTVDFQGGDYGTGYRAPGGGAAKNEFALHPSAVVLLLAYCRALGIHPAEQAELILELGKLSPGEQVKHWQAACIAKGIQPWQVLTIQAPMHGHDCSLCSHLITRQFAGDGGRRQFHWACGKGYLILETGRGTERIWIAPPECQSWERWYPSDQR